MGVSTKQRAVLRTSAGGCPAASALENRQRKGSGLTGPGLGNSQQVAASEEMWDRLRLDRRRHGIAFLVKRPPNRIDERKVLQI